MPNSARCMNPLAPTVKCYVCGEPVKTCQTHRHDICPVPSHARATKLPNKNWVCSHECYDTATKPKPEEVEHTSEEAGYGYGV